MLRKRERERERDVVISDEKALATFINKCYFNMAADLDLKKTVKQVLIP